MKRFVSSYLSLVTLCVLGCAVPRENMESAVGKRDGQYFVSENELNVTGFVDEALRYVGQSRYIDAEAGLVRADALQPGVDSIQFNLAVVLGKQGRYDEALVILERLVEKDPRSLQYQLAQGITFLGLRDFDRSVEILKKAFIGARTQGNDSLAASIARSLAISLYGAGREQEALCYSYEALTLNQMPEEFEKHLRFLLAENAYASVVSFSDAAVKVDTKVVKKSESGETISATPLPVDPATEAALKQNKDWGRNTTVKYFISLAQYELGDIEGALDSISDARDLVDQAPESQAEINAAFLVILNSLPEKLAEKNESEAFTKQIEDMKLLSLDLINSNEIIPLFWPPKAYKKLREIADEVEKAKQDQ